jgi:hypothetical protein
VSELAAANPSDPPAGAAELAELLTDESVDAIVAPHLSLLMMPGYSDAARAALSKVRNVAQQAALLSLTQYMSGVYDEGEEGEGNTLQAHIFEGGEPRLAELAALLAPIIETRLLPYVRAKFGCPDTCVADGLLRRYRAEERTSLALHYDVEALATAILPLSVQQGEEEGGGERSGNGRGDGDPVDKVAVEEPVKGPAAAKLRHVHGDRT